jgi:hypothetical protein
MFIHGSCLNVSQTLFAQISIFVLHNSFEEKTPGYLLLKVLRCFVEVDMYASLQVHTDQTIAAGRNQVTRFYGLLTVSAQSFPTEPQHILQ